MPRKDEKIFQQKRWVGGVGDYNKESANGQIQDAYYFGRAVNYRDDPQAITLLPASLKESGSVVTDLIKWGDRVPATLTGFFIGNAGNFYQRTNAGSWSNIGMLANNHGNGLAYFTGDDYIYVANDNSIARYGPTQNSPQLSANFLKAQGGVPQNTASLLLASASSMYGSAANSASLDITGNLTLETFFKANSLPTAGNSMTLIGKWDESGATRAYKMDIYGVSGYFGAGTDGSLTISSNTTEAPIDSTAIGTAGTQTLTATNVSFAVGQVILIHQSQGTGSGQWERNTIQGYTAGTITLGSPLIGTYGTGAQVRVLKQYTSVTVNTGVTWTAKAWTGTVGGILAFLATGILTVTGTISATGQGFAGGASVGPVGSQANGLQGVGTTGTGGNSIASNGNGGGAGSTVVNAMANGAGAGGGGNASTGGSGASTSQGTGGNGGVPSGANDLSTMTFGGGGGSGGVPGDSTSVSGAGGAGGGIIFPSAVTITITGSIVSNGTVGANGTTNAGACGGGAGGSINLKCQTASLGAGLITALAGAGGTPPGAGGAGGAGSVGRIAIAYLTSYTGTSTPTINAILDNTLVTTTTMQARLGISNDGTAFEYLTQNLNGLTTGVWNRLSITWTASTSTALFYLNAVLLGSFVGTKTSISNNLSLLYVGANKTSVIANYFDGLLNDMRVWNNVQSASQIFANNLIQLNASASGLQAYFKFNSAATDSTTNANTLTLVNSPTYSVDVPFPAPSTRLDIDTQNTNTGQTYSLLTSISEASVDTLPLTPVNDPQASVGFYVNAAGTGNWKVTVHDQQNRTIATQTILAANVPTGGLIEFIFATPWRILIGKKYHMHLTVSAGTSSVITGTTNDFSTAEYTSYFGFLVPDTQFHPMIQFQYQPLGGVLTGAVIIGNERYISVWDGANYSPNFIAFPPAWKVRCFSFWREFLAIGMWRGGNIYDFDAGRIYFWDGVSPTFNFFIDIPEGQINAMVGIDTNLFFFAGYRGYLMNYQGSYFFDTGNSNSNKLKRMPMIENGAYTEVYPGAMTTWRSLIHVGLFANSSSTNQQRGVYSFGTYNSYYPATLSYDYVISTGNRGSTVTIGCVFPVGQTLLTAWQDGISYGVDQVNFNNIPAPSGELQTFIMDDSAIWKEKTNFQVRADFLALKSGESIDVKINVGRSGFVSSTPDSTVGDLKTKLNFSGGRTHEYQIGVDLFATGATSPTLLGLSLLKDPLNDEEAF